MESVKLPIVYDLCLLSGDNTIHKILITAKRRCCKSFIKQMIHIWIPFFFLFLSRCDTCPTTTSTIFIQRPHIRKTTYFQIRKSNELWRCAVTVINLTYHSSRSRTVLSSRQNCARIKFIAVDFPIRIFAKAQPATCQWGSQRLDTIRLILVPKTSLNKIFVVTRDSFECGRSGTVIGGKAIVANRKLFWHRFLLSTTGG